VLREKGVKSALINLGGNILTLGEKPDGGPWKIGIQDPEKPIGTPLGVLKVPATSVVTSGGYERFFEAGGVRYHHVFDTHTGYPARSGLLAVSIITEKSMVADCYSTLLFALGLERSRTLLENARGSVDAIFITEDHRVYATPGARPRFQLTNRRYSLKDW
jgi:thiamine biosynthesis lipoprotein